MPKLTDQFLKIRQSYSEIFVIVSPPRSGSTALSRVFWEQPSVGYYAHEPFEIVYFHHRNIGEVLPRLRKPIDLSMVKRNPGNGQARALVIKEMPYQVGDYFKYLISLTDKPVIFLIRDPRLNIASRMRKKIEVGDSPLFPLIETGWDLLIAQITHCQKYRIPFILLDSTDFRRSPKVVFRNFFQALDLPYSPEYLKWHALPNLDLDNLNGSHTHLYTQVLESEEVMPDTDPLPVMETFPEENGFRDHVIHCLRIYHQLRDLPELIEAQPILRSTSPIS